MHLVIVRSSSCAFTWYVYCRKMCSRRLELWFKALWTATGQCVCVCVWLYMHTPQEDSLMLLSIRIASWSYYAQISTHVDLLRCSLDGVCAPNPYIYIYMHINTYMHIYKYKHECGYIVMRNWPWQGVHIRIWTDRQRKDIHHVCTPNQGKTSACSCTTHTM